MGLIYSFIWEYCETCIQDLPRLTIFQKKIILNVNVGFSFCLVIIVQLNCVQKSQKQNIISLLAQAFASQPNMAFSIQIIKLESKTFSHTLEKAMLG